MAYDHIEKLGSLLENGEMRTLLKSVSGSEKKLSELSRKLTDMETAVNAKRAEEDARRKQAEAEAAEAAKATCASRLRAGTRPISRKRAKRPSRTFSRSSSK